jgi:hypothetical protein
MVGLSPEWLERLDDDRATRVAWNAAPEIVSVNSRDPAGRLAPPPCTITFHVGDRPQELSG